MPEYIAKSVAIARLTTLEIGNPCATIEDARRTIADTRPADVDTVTREKRRNRVWETVLQGADGVLLRMHPGGG